MTLLLILQLSYGEGMVVDFITKFVLYLLIPIVVCCILYKSIEKEDDNKNTKNIEEYNEVEKIKDKIRDDINKNEKIEEKIKVEENIVNEEKVKIEEFVVKDAQFEYLKHIEENNSYAKIIKHIAFDKIEELYLPKEIDNIPITIIGEEAFCHDKLINKIILPDNVKIIEKSAFQFSSLKYIILGKNTEKIGSYAFYSCKIEYIYIPTYCGLKIDSHAFYGVNMGNVTITPSTQCSEKSFEFSKIEKIEIQEGVKNLYQEEFYFSTIKKVLIPSSITKIPTKCFYGCDSLEKILIPSSVTAIGDKAFEPIEESYVTCLDGTPDMRYNSHYYDLNLDVTIYCEAGSYAQEFARKNGFNCRPISEF